MSDNARKLWERGFSVIPIHPTDKYPCDLHNNGWGVMKYKPMSKWNQYSERLPNEAEIASWETWHCNIGVTLGELSGIIALDLDDDVEGLHAKILAIVPKSPFVKIGQKGQTLFFKYNEELNRKLTWNKEGTRVAELLTNGQQTVLPPSIHPKGMAYVCAATHNLYDSELGDMPRLTMEMVEQIDILFRPKFQTMEVAPIVNDHFIKVTTEMDLVIEALEYLDCNEYDEWVQVGMSLKTSYGDDGYSLWVSWSSKSEKFKSDEMDAKWKSFTRSDRTAGSIIHTAQQHGFIATQNVTAPPRVQILAGGNLIPTLKAELAIHDEDIPVRLLNAPGMIGRTMEYILETSLYPQPVLALGAAITAVGNIMAHKCQLEKYGLRTNMYVLGLAPSATGKDHPRSAIKRIYQELGLHSQLVGVPRSSAAVPKMVVRTKGRALLLWDEIGRYMESICNAQKGSAHEAQITTFLMEMYNHAREMYIGGEFSDNAAQGGRADIDQPCLNIFGTATPGKFYDNLSGADVDDGFLTRWLIFETQRIDEYVNELRKPMNPPESLLAEYARWEREPLLYLGEATNSNLQIRIIDPKIIPITPSGHIILGEFMNLARKKRITYHKSGHNEAGAVWGRAGEHAFKLALVAHDYGQPITAETAQWAVDLADNRADFMVRATATHLASSKHEKFVKKVFALIQSKRKSGMALTELYNQTKYLLPKERADALDTLINSGLVIKVSVKGQGVKPLTFLKDASM